MTIEHLLTFIGIIVGITSLIITGTCGLVVWWIRSIREDLKDLGEDFSKFVQMYYEKHEETIKKEDCTAKHAILDHKVDKLHERVDELNKG